MEEKAPLDENNIPKTVEINVEEFKDLIIDCYNLGYNHAYERIVYPMSDIILKAKVDPLHLSNYLLKRDEGDEPIRVKLFSMEEDIIKKQKK